MAGCGPRCEQTHAAFEVGLSLDQGQGVYSGRSDVVGSSQVRHCHTCIIDVMQRAFNATTSNKAKSGTQSLLFSTRCRVKLFKICFIIFATKMISVNYLGGFGCSCSLHGYVEIINTPKLQLKPYANQSCWWVPYNT